MPPIILTLADELNEQARRYLFVALSRRTKIAGDCPLLGKAKIDQLKVDRTSTTMGDKATDREVGHFVLQSD